MTAEFDSQFTKLTGARQTMSSWAKVIESFGSLPRAYTGLVKRFMKEGQSLPYMVLAPAIAGRQSRASEKLLLIADGVFYILENAAGQVSITGYPLDQICDLEVGIILLYSWLRVSGKTLEGAMSATTVEYNTSTARYFVPFISKLRSIPVGGDADSLKAERDKFDGLSHVDFKFMNYARESLAPGEQVFSSLWQSKIRKPVASLLGLTFYRTTALAHLLILTDQEVILISDDERTLESRGVRYGGKWRYLPVRHIASAEVTVSPEGPLTLTLELVTGEHVESMYTLDQQEKLALFKAELEKLSSIAPS